CSYLNHHLTPEEVTGVKGGEARFEAHGGGHAIAIYEVSKDTTRADIGQYLCVGFDRTLGPASHPCNLLAANANAQHNILDGKGAVVIVAASNPPDAQVLSEPG